MGHSDSGTRGRDTAYVASDGGDSLRRCMDRVQCAFAVTRGDEHRLVYANAAFRRLLTATHTAIGSPISKSMGKGGPDARALSELLDRVVRTGDAERNNPIASSVDGEQEWRCSAWPTAEQRGQPAFVLIELGLSSELETTLTFQRRLTERILVGALREQDAAIDAETSRRRAVFLASAGRRLAESIDEESTLHSLAMLALPNLGSWCIVDIIASDGAMRRLAIVHSDPVKQNLLLSLKGRWEPEAGDPFGAPMAMVSSGPTTISDDLASAVTAAAHDPEILRILQEVGIGPLLTVPMIMHDKLIGAITFVGGSRSNAFTSEDVELAEDLGTRSAIALDNSRMHSDAVSLRNAADTANKAKSAFLGTMSHELRTPLNAIGGYVDLIDMGLRGPVSPAQHTDLARIRSNQRHLLALITDILNYVHVGSGQIVYEIGDIVLNEMLTSSLEMVESLLLQKEIATDRVSSGKDIVARGDSEKVAQIIVNLLSNAIKFTRPRGRIRVDCGASETTGEVRIADTGIGIPPEMLASIFDPFVQVKDSLAGLDRGVGLGLAISRDLARGMGGDLTVESEVGVGSRFTLSLPIAESRKAG